MRRQQWVILGCSILILLMLGGCGKNAKSQEQQNLATNDENCIVTIEDEMVPEAAVPKRIQETSDNQNQEAVKQETEKVVNNLTAAQGNPVGVPEDLKKDQATVKEETSPKVDTAELTSSVIARINAVRKDKGIGSLSTTPQLMTAAGVRAGETAEKFSHTRPNGSDFCTVLDETGAPYGYAGENVFNGYSTAQSVEQAWNQSQNHLMNILDGNYHHVGVGCVQTDKGVFLVQVFTD